MHASKLFGQTLRQAPGDAELASHKLLVRGAFIRRIAAGSYAWLPLGRRVLDNITRIVRQEMDAAGGVELLMPALLPRELLDASGRNDPAFWGGELYTLTDPGGRDCYLGPTHEEVFAAVAATELPSYRDLPSLPYQVQWKYRYAPRPRGGLLRAREFLMKDAYSFDPDEDSLHETYARVRDAYRRIFERCGLSPMPIEAQPGTIGGGYNEEFTQPSDAGEDTFVRCPACGYAANTEAATGLVLPSSDDTTPAQQITKVHTPGMTSVTAVSAELACPPSRLIKALLFSAGEQIVCALVPGDRELNELKLTRAVGRPVAMLTDEDFSRTGFVKGFAGPVGLQDALLLADRSLDGASGRVCGANEADHHLTGVSVGRDFVPDRFEDLVLVRDGDPCPRCEGALSTDRGIEVAHIFQLGTKYADAIDATYAAEDGSRRPFVMGCYGLGISRVVAAIVECHHDDRGITWPASVAPFEVAILQLSTSSGAGEAATRLYDGLRAEGTAVLLDDRPLSAGVKFGDADLIGYPLQVVVGKRYDRTGAVEVIVRATGERTEVAADTSWITGALATCP